LSISNEANCLNIVRCSELSGEGEAVAFGGIIRVDNLEKVLEKLGDQREERRAFPFGSRSMHGRSSNSVARVTRPTEPATKIRPYHVVNNKGPASKKGPAIGAKAGLALDLLFTVAQDTAASLADRRKAASQAAEFFLPKNARGKKSRRGKFPPDEHGFVVDPELARELRDSKLKLACLGLEKKRRPYAIQRPRDWLRSAKPTITDCS